MRLLTIIQKKFRESCEHIFYKNYFSHTVLVGRKYSFILSCAHIHRGLFKYQLWWEWRYHLTSIFLLFFLYLSYSHTDRTRQIPHMAGIAIPARGLNLNFYNFTKNSTIHVSILNKTLGELSRGTQTPKRGLLA